MTLQEYYAARLQEAETTGSPLACYEVGRCLELGLGTVVDNKAAKIWYQRVFDNDGFKVIKEQAENGEVEAQFILGKICEKRQAGDLSVAEDETSAEAVKWYRKAAEQDYAVAQYYLGVAYINGSGVARNPVEAIKWFRKAAEQEDASAQYALGLKHASGGPGIVKDEVEATKWFHKAAEQGLVKAQSKLGGMYANGSSVAQDEVEAAKWYCKAAEQGDVQAQSKLGVMYTKGSGVAKDVVEAFKWYRKAAEQGDVVAQCNLGKAYAKGLGIPQDNVQAVKWYRKAAKQGYAEAQCELGIMHAMGRGVAQNNMEAVKWYRKAAKQGYAEAQKRLAFMYRQGRGVAKDDVEAVKWCRKAAEQGDASQQNTVGWCYAIGLGVTRDYSEAIKWYLRAAEQGNVFAQENLGSLYLGGAWGTIKEGINWLEKAIAQNNSQLSPQIRLSLRVIYEEGLGVAKDAKKAAVWSDKATKERDDPTQLVGRSANAEEANYAFSQYCLGWLYEHGFGVAQDDLEAARWYRQAAEQGYEHAQFKLGSMYANGRGVEQDEREALQWYSKAAEQGHEAAINYLKTLSVTVPSEPQISSLTSPLQHSLNDNSNLQEKRQGTLQEYYAARLQEAETTGSPLACYEVGRCLELGLGAVVDKKAAKIWYQRVFDNDGLKIIKEQAENGEVEAQFILGKICEKRQAGDLSVSEDETNAEAVKWYRKAAEQAHAVAEYYLALMYNNGFGVAKDAVEAAKWYRKAAEQGFAIAQYYLGTLYTRGVNTRGLSVSRDDVEAVKWYRKAAKQGYAEAQRKLGDVYANGSGVAKDVVEAAKWYSKAAEQGNAQAQSKLGDMYASSGIAQDAVEAFKWYRKAAGQGDAVGQCNLGKVYAKGLGVFRDDLEAVKWYRKAAKQGYAEAQCELGLMYANGFGVARNDAEAVKWYRKAAKQSCAKAQNRLAFIYRDGGRGVAKDDVESFKWRRKAAEQGDAGAQNSVGWCYAIGQVVTRDYSEAIKWYLRAAEQGLVFAQENLGSLYLGGVWGTIKEGIDWLEKAAAQNDPRLSPQIRLSLRVIYEEGLGVAKDAKEAAAWSDKATKERDDPTQFVEGTLPDAEKANYAFSQYCLGWLYEQGFGVAQDDVEAVKWYRKAAEQGYEHAQFKLGSLYTNGRGVVAQDEREALQWYSKAAEQGHEAAINYLKSLGVAIPTSDMASLEESRATSLPPGTFFKSPKPTVLLKKPSSEPSISRPGVKLPPKKGHSPVFRPSSPSLSPLHSLWQIDHNEVGLGQVLGHGGCGTVYQGIWHHNKVAVKQLHGGLNKQALEEFQQEAAIAASLRHPHVVQLFGATQEAPYYMVMEYMGKGSLHDVLLNEDLDWKARVKYGLNITRGLAFLHAKGIIHRDMKSLNVLVSKKDDIKLSDFGLSKVKQSMRTLSKQANPDGMVGTVAWKAPELFKLGAKHTVESDVYSLGMVLWELTTSAFPYEIAEGDEDQIRAHVLADNREDLNPDAPPFLNDLIVQCWLPDPKNRPALGDVIETLKQGLRELKGKDIGVEEEGETESVDLPSGQDYSGRGRLLQDSHNNNNSNDSQGSFSPIPGRRF